MYLKEIRIENFTSYRGERRIRFEKNLNIVIGQTGVGKTNLARAISLALTGMIPDGGPLSGLHMFNDAYLRDCERDAATPRWEVEADVVLDGDCYSALCRAVISRGEVIFTHRSPLEIQQQAFHNGSSLYVRAEGGAAKLGRVVIPSEEMAIKRVMWELNGEEGLAIGFALVDAYDARLSTEWVREWIRRFEESDMEQVILLLSDESEVDFTDVHANIVYLCFDYEEGGTFVREPNKGATPGL
jgi:energy-coupling factor transporter ATP-binding protein EcfA2